MRDGVANGGFTALIAFFPEQFKDPVGGVALFAWQSLILREERLNTLLVGAKDWGRLLALDPPRFCRIIGNGTSHRIPAASLLPGDLADAFFLQVIAASNPFTITFTEDSHSSPPYGEWMWKAGRTCLSLPSNTTRTSNNPQEFPDF